MEYLHDNDLNGEYNALVLDLIFFLDFELSEKCIGLR